MSVNEQLQFLLAGLSILFFPMVVSKLIRVIFRREMNPFSESFMEDVIQEEHISGRVLMEGIYGNGP